MGNIIIQLIASFFGSLGFSLLFNVQRKKLLPCALGGVLVWIVYLFCVYFLSLDLLAASVACAAACQLFAEIMARKMKAPTTTFCIPALVPLIPGGALYRTMEAVISRNWQLFRVHGGTTLKVTIGIAIGLSLISASVFLLGKVKRKSKKF